MIIYVAEQIRITIIGLSNTYLIQNMDFHVDLVAHFFALASICRGVSLFMTHIRFIKFPIEPESYSRSSPTLARESRLMNIRLQRKHLATYFIRPWKFRDVRLEGLVRYV